MPRALPTALQPLVSEAIRQRGLDEQAFLAARAEQEDVLEAAARLTGDDAIGLHLAEALEERAVNALVYLVMSATTLGDALRKLAEFARILGGDGGLVLAPEAGRPGCQRLSHSVLPDGASRQHAEFSAVGVLRLCRYVTGHDVMPVAVSFKHKRPVDVVSHRRIFRAPLGFSARQDALVFDEGVLALPSRHSDPAVHAFHLEFAERQLAQLNGNVVRRLEGALLDVLEPGPRDVDAMAQVLAMSTRTLQRRLSEAGASYKTVLDSVRKRVALDRLNESGVPIQEVARQAGFDDYSAFYRSFRRWTGTSPAGWRRSQGN